MENTLIKKNTLKKFIVIFMICIYSIKTAGVVDFKLQDLDSNPLDLIFCGNAKDTVIVLTEKNSLYRSDDHGFTWKKLNDVLMHTGKAELEESETEIGQVSKIIESPVDKSLLIFLGSHGINWIGEDCGRKVKALNHGRKIQEYVFHPTEKNWGLASAFTLCEDFTNGEPCKIYKELFLTKDLGENWEILGPYIVQFGWGMVKDNLSVPKERILVTLEPHAKGDQKSSGWSYKVDFVYSDDFFKSKRIAAHKGNKFLLTKDYIFVAQVVDQDLQEVVLLVGKSTDKVYNFSTIETTSKRFKEHAYTFLNYSENSVFLHINHFGDHSKYGHIYTSDIDGLKYSLSLKYNIRSSDGKCDFQSIESLEGVFIANVIEEEYMSVNEQEMDEELMEEQGNMSVDKKTHGRNGHLDEGHKNYIQTMLSMNKGGSWTRIIAPSRRMDGKKFDCEGERDCFLNLHGTTSEFPQFYSVSSAAGIILSNGNVGKYLSNDGVDISTFLSRDGGLSWFEVRKGSHIYEIGNHGALIVMADDQNPTDEVLYSWDEGLSFQELKISSEKIMIKNIIIEPESTSQHFVVYGESHNKKGEKKGVVIGMNFSSLHVTQCRNPDEPDTANSDYEKWIPGRTGHECILGKKIIYVRRKREAECYNGLSFEKKSIIQFCDCVDEDYECDTGFARASVGGPCTPLNSNTIVHKEGDIHEPPAICDNYFSISKGYRKIPGNSCVNGVKYDPIMIPCPGTFFAGLGKIFFLLVVFILGFGLIFLAFNIGIFEKIQNLFRSNESNNIHTHSKLVNLYFNIF